MQAYAVKTDSGIKVSLPVFGVLLDRITDQLESAEAGLYPVQITKIRIGRGIYSAVAKVGKRIEKPVREIAKLHRTAVRCDRKVETGRPGIGRAQGAATAATYAMVGRRKAAEASARWISEAFATV